MVPLQTLNNLSQIRYTMLLFKNEPKYCTSCMSWNTVLFTSLWEQIWYTEFKERRNPWLHNQHLIVIALYLDIMVTRAASLTCLDTNPTCNMGFSHIIKLYKCTMLFSHEKWFNKVLQIKWNRNTTSILLQCWRTRHMLQDLS